MTVNQHRSLRRQYRRLAWRSATAPLRALPSVFVLGATKAGSTTIANLLWHHPSHRAALHKEPMYLQQLPQFESNFERTAMQAWLHGRMHNGHARYSQLGYRKFFPLASTLRTVRKRTGHAFTSDCDPFNLYCPVATRRIREFTDHPRLIISLRDPAARAYSDYNMHRERAGETRSFLQCLEDELAGTEQRFRKRFLHQSVYYPHVHRWRETFGEQNTLVVRAEDLFTDPGRISAAIFDFLGVPATGKPVQPSNAGSYEQSMGQAESELLEQHFKDPNQRLFDYLQRDFAWSNSASSA